jgi:hypothetical protein
MRTVLRIVGNAAGPIGVGLTLTGWLNPLVGVVCLAFGAGYVIWEIFTLEWVTQNVPWASRILGVAVVASIAIGLAWKPVRAAIGKKQESPHSLTATEIASEVWKQQPKGSVASNPPENPSRKVEESQSQLEVYNVVGIPMINGDRKGFALNVYYANTGKIPVTSMAHRDITVFAPKPLSREEELDYERQADSGPIRRAK